MPFSKNGAGAFILGPQRRFPAQTREEWARLAVNRQFHLECIRGAYADRLPIVERAMDNIDDGNTPIWPLQTLPKLDRWWSADPGRVILIGDAADE